MGELIRILPFYRVILYWKIDPFVFSLLMITVVFLRLPSSLGVVLRPPFVSSTCYDNNDMLLVTSPKAS